VLKLSASFVLILGASLAVLAEEGSRPLDPAEMQSITGGTCYTLAPVTNCGPGSPPCNQAAGNDCTYTAGSGYSCPITNQYQLQTNGNYNGDCPTTSSGGNIGCTTLNKVCQTKIPCTGACGPRDSTGTGTPVCQNDPSAATSVSGSDVAVGTPVGSGCVQGTN